jgi:hypothetical protein
MNDDAPSTGLLHGLFLQQVAIRPNEIAVIAPSRVLTFG